MKVADQMQDTTPTYRNYTRAIYLAASFLLVILPGQVRSQAISSAEPMLDSLLRYVQNKYGLDQELYSGTQYYQRYSMYKGDPYFLENRFYGGSISLQGETYDGLQLKYDIYSQRVVLEYTDYENRYNQLIIDSTRIDSFRFNGYPFKKVAMPEGEPLFYQVFESSPVAANVHWSKTAITFSSDLQYTHRFSNTVGTCYIEYDGQIRAVRNRKSLIAIFPDSMARLLRKYFREKKLSFREAEPEDLQHLIQFIAHQLNASPLQ